MTLKELKQRAFGVICCNTKLRDFEAKHYKSHEEREVVKLVQEMSRIDTIKDCSPLIELKKEIVEKGKMFCSHNGNNTCYRLYGIGNALFGDRLEDVCMTPAIEHGLIFWNKNWTDTAYAARASCITFGTFRKQILRRYYKTPIFEAGPYIQYASDYYTDEEMKAWKKKLGKTLLVFPMHGTDDDELTYNIKTYIDKIEQQRADCDTVIVCAFWWNIDDPIIRVFKDMGYLISSAGYREDPNFLRRQKSLIKIADKVISDSVGTHIGYCYKLGKQVELVSARTDFEGDIDEFIQKQFLIIKHAMEGGAPKELEKIMNFYWGNDISLTRAELEDIAIINRDITVSGRYMTKKFPDASHDLLKRYYKENEMSKYKLLKRALE